MKNITANSLRIAALALALALAGTSGGALADAPLFEASGSMIGGSQFDSFSFEITALEGEYIATLLDYAFPTDSFDVLSLAIAKGASILGSVQGSGSFSFDPVEAGTYTALVFGTPAGAFQAGSYGISVNHVGASVTAVPEAENWALLLTGLGLVGLAIGRREPVKVLAHSH